MKKVIRVDSTRAAPARGGPSDPDLLAVQVLVYLAADVARFDRFLSVTGLDPISLRKASAEPGFARAILSYLASNEALLIAFAHNDDLDPERVGHAARAAIDTPSADI